MKAVGTGLGHGRHNTPAAPAVHRRVTVRLHAHFVNTLDGWQHGEAHNARNVALIEHRDAIQLKIRCGLQPAIKGVANRAGEEVALVIVRSGRRHARLDCH